jgi:hypothetical protein
VSKALTWRRRKNGKVIWLFQKNSDRDRLQCQPRKAHLGDPPSTQSKHTG